MRKDIYLSLYNEYKSIIANRSTNKITMVLKYQMKWLEKLMLLYLQKSKLENIILNSIGNKKSFHLSKKGVANESIKKSDDNQINVE